MEVDFITLGDASERLKVPSPTLRNWTDQLEEFDVHFVKRNNRNERIYFDADLKIFEYVRDLKKEYGRRTNMENIVRMLVNEERFELRKAEDAPSPVLDPSNKTGDLLHPDDVKSLMESQRVRALLSIVVAESTNQIQNQLTENFQKEMEKQREVLKAVLKEEIRQELEENKKVIGESLSKFQEEQKIRDEEERQRILKRDEETLEYFRNLKEKWKEQEELEKSKGFFSKIFGKK